MASAARAEPPVEPAPVSSAPVAATPETADGVGASGGPATAPSPLNYLRGKAVIRCTVVAKGKLDGCTVLSEDPPNGGFGDMALGASKEMRLDGPGAIGGTVTIPMTFNADGRKSPRR
jgi:protein TonB